MKIQDNGIEYKKQKFATVLICHNTNNGSILTEVNSLDVNIAEFHFSHLIPVTKMPLEMLVFSVDYRSQDDHYRPGNLSHLCYDDKKK